MKSCIVQSMQKYEGFSCWKIAEISHFYSKGGGEGGGGERGDILLRGIRPFCKLWKRVLLENPFKDLGKSLFVSCLFVSHTATRFTY